MKPGEPAPVMLTPLMGRDTEFGLLEDRWEQAQEGMGQVVFVVGQPGLGKSRLVQTLKQRVQEERPDGGPTRVSASAQDTSPVIEWRCSQRFRDSELHPVSDFLERFIGVGGDPSPTSRFDRLAQHLQDYDLGRPELVALFGKLLFLPPDERYSVASFTPAREREETFRALHQYLRAFSGKRSLLFVVEDLHWMDASTLEFLGHFIEKTPMSES